MCGGKLYAQTGTISSPGYPDNYAPGKDCVWIISAPTGKQIELIVKGFDLESDSSCDYDFLEIRY